MRTMADLVCWKCGFSLSELTLPIGRRDACPACEAELHSCRACVDYDPAVAQQCREPTAEAVTDKSRANFCGFFNPKPSAFVIHDQSSAQQAEAQLHALFAQSADASEAKDHNAQNELEQLFSQFPEKDG